MNSQVQSNMPLVKVTDKISVRFEILTGCYEDGTPAFKYEFRSGVVKQVKQTYTEFRYLVHFENGSVIWIGLSPKLEGMTWKILKNI